MADADCAFKLPPPPPTPIRRPPEPEAPTAPTPPAKPTPAAFDPSHPPVSVLTKKDLVAWWSYVVQEAGFKGSDRVMASKLLADALGMFKTITHDNDDFDASKMTDEELVANVKQLLVACRPSNADTETA